MDDGEIFTYALGKLDDRGRMFVKANDPVYEGMIVGIHSRDNDLVVNATRTKATDQLPRQRQGRRDQDHAPIDPHAGIRREFIGTMSWSRSPQVCSPAQAPPEGKRPQARQP